MSLHTLPVLNADLSSSHLPPSPKARVPLHTGDEAPFIAPLRAGNEVAFVQLVRTQSNRLLTVARHILRNEEDAREAVQDAFLSAFRARDQFEGSSQISTWLYRIVVNASLMKLRVVRRRRENLFDPRTGSVLEQHLVTQPLRPENECIENLLQRRELHRTIYACINRLPEVHRTVLLLRDIEELNTQETAHVLKVSTNAVKIRLYRARRALRVLLETSFD